MDAARSTSWSSLPPCAVPVAGACAASPCLTGSDLRSVPGLGSACAASASGRVSCHGGHTGTAAQGGFEQRSAHTFAEMVQAFVEEETTTTSAKERLQSMIASARIVCPKFSIPSVVGMGSPHATSAPKPGSLVTHQHRIVKAHLVALSPPWRIRNRSLVEYVAAQHLARRARMRSG